LGVPNGLGAGFGVPNGLGAGSGVPNGLGAGFVLSTLIFLCQYHYINGLYILINCRHLVVLATDIVVS